jgi:hypothetical protein
MIPNACQITFIGMDAVEAAKLEVRAWLPRLGVLTAEVTGGHVRIEAMDERRKERRYRVSMELAMPEGVVVVTHEHPSNSAHEDLCVAIRNAFRAARRQLEEYFKDRPVPAGTDRDSGGGNAEATALGPQSENGPVESALHGVSAGISAS